MTKLIFSNKVIMPKYNLSQFEKFVEKDVYTLVSHNNKDYYIKDSKVYNKKLKCIGKYDLLKNSDIVLHLD